MCKKCGKKAIIEYPYPMCNQHFKDYYLQTVQKTIEKYKMFNKEDRILVAVSGGKDSSALVYALYELGYEFEGLYINLEIPNYSEYSEKAVKELFKLINYKINIIRVSDYNVKVKQIHRRPICSVCGIIKRYLMNRFAYENGFTVIATAHNLIDEAAFFLMNMNSGQIQYLIKQEPVLPKENKFVKKVKPLYFLTERENMIYSIINKLPVYHGSCPNASGNPQAKWKHILYKIENENPGFIRNFVNFMLKLKRYIYYPEKKEEIFYCKYCGYPTGSKGKICAFCKIQQYFNNNKKLEL